MLAATVVASCRDVSGRMTEAQSAHEFTDRAGQTASTERVTPATTEPERDAQFTSTAPAGQDEPAEPAQTTTARTPVTEEREISRIEKIPFDTEYVWSDEEYEDFLYVSVNGRSGLLQITEKSIYEDGILIGTETVETVISEAEKRVIIIGTKPIYTSETVTETEEVPFETELIKDSSLYEDERTTVSAGRNGRKTAVYEVTYERGKEISRRVISEKTLSPEAAKVRVGTKPVFTYETVTKKENTVAYPVRYVYDDTIPEGERRTRTKGKDGYTENTYKITYERGVETKSELVSSSVTEPVAEVIAIGTKKKEETFAMPFRTAAQGGANYGVTQYYGGSNSHGDNRFYERYGHLCL